MSILSKLDGLVDQIIDTLATRLYIFNGTTWDRIRFPAALGSGGGLKIDGSGTALPITGTLTVDTEFPPAAALADATANPTTPTLGAALLVFNGTTWDRVRFPAALGAGGGLKVDGSGTALPVSGPVTNTELRATAVPVSGPVTNTELRATAVPVSGPLTNTELRATPVPVTADTELPAAAALSDTIANPTTPTLGAALLGWSGTVWKRLITNVFNTLSVNIFNSNGELLDFFYSLNDSDATLTASHPTVVVDNFARLYNNSSWDRERSNFSVEVLPSVARTASENSWDLINHNAKGIIVTIDVTSVTLTPSIVFTIAYKDPTSLKYVALLVSAAITAVGTYSLTVYPGVAEAANTKASMPLPRIWRVQAVAGDADSITYSVAADYIN